MSALEKTARLSLKKAPASSHQGGDVARAGATGHRSSSSSSTFPRRREPFTRQQGGSGSTIDIENIEHLLFSVPQKNKNFYGQVGFAKWGSGGGGASSYRPCLVMNPDHLRVDDPILLEYMKRFEKLKANNSEEELDKKMFHLVFFYWDASSRQMFGFVSQKDFMAYDDGLAAGATVVPRAIQAKLDAGNKTLLTESENAKLRARAMVAEDLSKEPHERRRGFLDLDDDTHGNDTTNAAETVVTTGILRDKQKGPGIGDDADPNAKNTEVGRVGGIIGGRDGGDAPTSAGFKGQDGDNADLHVESDSLEAQLDHAYNGATDNQSEGGGIVEQQPMFEHQHKLLSPPSALAEPRVLYAEQQENEDDDAKSTGNGDQDGQGAGQGAADAEEAEDVTVEAEAVRFGHNAAESAGKEILEEAKVHGSDDDDDVKESSDSNKEEAADNDEEENMDDIDSDAGQHSNNVAADVKKKRRVSAEVRQAEISLQASLQALTDAQSKTFNQILWNVKGAAMEEKEALMKEHNDNMTLQKEALAKQHDDKMAEQKEVLEKRHSETIKEQAEAMAKQYDDKGVALEKQYNDKVVALEKQHSDKGVERDQTEQTLMTEIASLNAAVAEHERKERELADKNNALRAVTDNIKALMKSI